jgi:hypothetical protein
MIAVEHLVEPGLGKSHDVQAPVGRKTAYLASAAAADKRRTPSTAAKQRAQALVTVAAALQHG